MGAGVGVYWNSQKSKITFYFIRKYILEYGSFEIKKKKSNEMYNARTKLIIQKPLKCSG